MEKRNKARDMARKAASLAMAALLAATLSPASALAVAGGRALSAKQPAITAKAAKTAIAKSNVTVKDLKWTGKKQAADVTVKVKGKVLEAGSDYTLAVKNAKGKAVAKPSSVGKYTVTVIGKGAYKGTVSKVFKVWSKDGKKWQLTTKEVVSEKKVKVVDRPEDTLDVLETRDEGGVAVWGGGEVDEDGYDYKGFWVSYEHPEIAYWPMKGEYDPWHLKYNDGYHQLVAMHTDETDPNVHKVVLPEFLRKVYASDFEQEFVRGNGVYPGTSFTNAIHDLKGRTIEGIRQAGIYSMGGYATREETADAVAPFLAEFQALPKAGHVCGRDLKIYTGRHTQVVPEASHYEVQKTVKKVSTWAWC